jgi:hypothetical protein
VRVHTCVSWVCLGGKSVCVYVHTCLYAYVCVRVSASINNCAENKGGQVEECKH